MSADSRWEKLRTTYKRAQFVGHHSVCVETSDIFDLLREVGRVRALEAALAMAVAEMEAVRPLLKAGGWALRAARLGSTCDHLRRALERTVP